MEYDKHRAEIEVLENHKEFKKTIKRICEGDFIISSINPLNHITSLQNKIEVYIKNEERIRNSGKFQNILDANCADSWLTQKFNDLLGSGMLFKQLQK